MLERYLRDEMKYIWSDEFKYTCWLEVELALIKAWNKLGLINDLECQKILKNASFNIEQIQEIESTTKHDLIAFTTSVASFLGEEGRWIHYGITSSDCIDTANALLLKKSLAIILKDVDCLLSTLESKAKEHKNTLMVGRSHGIYGEPITFGLSIAIWYDAIKRQKQGLALALQEISVGQVSGAMGNLAHTSIELENLVCEFLDLKPASITNQIIGRERYARVINELALLASICEGVAINIRHLQRSEVYEAEEFFSKGQKGSSAMPHKRNPILSENITGLCRMIRGYSMPMMESVALWHERDISHSSVERYVLPDIFSCADFMLFRLNDLIKNLVVYPKNMLKNLNLTGGLVFSQRVLLELPKKGLSREDAYKIVQRNAMRVWQDLQDAKDSANMEIPLFLQYLLEDKELLESIKPQDIKECFEYSYYLKNVDSIFNRVFS